MYSTLASALEFPSKRAWKLDCSCSESPLSCTRFTGLHNLPQLLAGGNHYLRKHQGRGGGSVQEHAGLGRFADRLGPRMAGGLQKGSKSRAGSTHANLLSRSHQGDLQVSTAPHQVHFNHRQLARLSDKSGTSPQINSPPPLSQAPRLPSCHPLLSLWIRCSLRWNVRCGSGRVVEFFTVPTLTHSVHIANFGADKSPSFLLGEH